MGGVMLCIVSGCHWLWLGLVYLYILPILYNSMDIGGEIWVMHPTVTSALCPRPFSWEYRKWTTRTAFRELIHEALSDAAPVKGMARMPPASATRLHGTAKLQYVTEVRTATHAMASAFLLCAGGVFHWLAVIVQLFDRIADRYDFVNLIISLGHTTLWRLHALLFIGKSTESTGCLPAHPGSHYWRFFRRHFHLLC